MMECRSSQPGEARGCGSEEAEDRAGENFKKEAALCCIHFIAFFVIESRKGLARSAIYRTFPTLFHASTGFFNAELI